MNRIFILLLLLVPLIASGQPLKHGVTHITRDSIPYKLEENWKFHLGDSANWASQAYSDSSWEVCGSPELNHSDRPRKDYQEFSSICWLRLHLFADSTVTQKPLAIKMSHYGASEIYLDGKKIQSYGKINGPDSSEYEDPQYIPFFINFPDTGSHILAIRYANYNAKRNKEVYYKYLAGLRIYIWPGNPAMENERSQTVAFSAIFIFLFSVFFTLSLLHLLLFLFHREVRSNLYFSIFCMSLALLFMISFIARFTIIPEWEVKVGIGTVIFVATSCFSLSGFNNELFSARKIRLWIIGSGCFICCALFFVWPEAGFGLFVLILAVTLESVILTLRAIYRKVPGAKIIGIGVLLFGLFFFLLSVLAIIFSEVSFNDGTLFGKLMELFAIVAILSMPVSMSAYLAWNFARINKGLKHQLIENKLLSDKTIQQEREKQQMLESRKEELEKEVALRTGEVVAQKEEIEKQHEELKKEKKKSDDLLLNILPEEVAEELKDSGKTEAKFFDHVTVLFTDFVDFTKAGERMTPKELVDELHACFKAFDEIISRFNIEKIKTIGDAYLAVCGLPLEDKDHAAKIIYAALQIRDFMTDRKTKMGDKTFDIRIGVHSGSVVAGIVGVKKFAYDIWGDTVNTAARMEQNSTVGRINISQATYDLIKDKFECTYRGEITAKNKGALQMYYIEQERSER